MACFCSRRRGRKDRVCSGHGQVEISNRLKAVGDLNLELREVKAGDQVRKS